MRSEMKRQFYVIERTPFPVCHGIGCVIYGTEELTCGECEGKGKIEREVPLIEALREINKDA